MTDSLVNTPMPETMQSFRMPMQNIGKHLIHRDLSLTRFAMASGAQHPNRISSMVSSRGD
ncbi:hypothetical protein [Mycobacterium sp. GA-1199]|uniref:hypothetical protein n=1 Tax=Mycobacterium sp. GA-1199 TaxID=1772287 RepID=UPI0012E3EB84|nr:hypothetical protein [Mycobacterium sp. GA-1199]